MINIALQTADMESLAERVATITIHHTLGKQNHRLTLDSFFRPFSVSKIILFLVLRVDISIVNDNKILFQCFIVQLLPVRSNLQVNGTNTSLIHSSINCGHVTISAQHFLMIILSPTLCVIITPALLVMYLPSGEMIEIIYTDLLC